MREIKFRAWDRTTNYWLKGIESVLHASGRLLNPPHIELTQFTGLQDKNGKDIYEGDIVKSYPWGITSKPAIEVVSFGEQVFHDSNDDEQSIQGYNIDPHMGYEVIGNIYETPELIAE